MQFPLLFFFLLIAFLLLGFKKFGLSDLPDEDTFIPGHAVIIDIAWILYK